jgi:hypothetical protein
MIVPLVAKRLMSFRRCALRYPDQFYHRFSIGAKHRDFHVGIFSPAGERCSAASRAGAYGALTGPPGSVFPAGSLAG